MNFELDHWTRTDSRRRRWMKIDSKHGHLHGILVRVHCKIIQNKMAHQCVKDFTSARIRMPKYWNHVEIKKFLPLLFMTFLDVSEVPEHDKAKKKIVSLCLWICGSVTTITPLRKLLQSSFWCQNLCNFNTVNWKAFELCSVTETWHASPKRHNFKGFFHFW
jgi:hypothetical protein